MIKETQLTERIGIKIGMLFSAIPLSPNAWTLLSIVPALIGFAALLQKQLLAGIVLFALSAFIDAIDGGVARVTGRTSALGAYLDGMMDRLVEALLLFGLMFYGLPDLVVFDYATPAYAWIALLLFAGTCFTSFAKAYADHRKTITDEKLLARMGGLLERPERLILIFAGMVAGLWDSGYVTGAIALAGILACATVLQRVWFTVKNAR